MYSLLVETSTDRGVVAVAKDDYCLKSVELAGSRDLAKTVSDLCLSMNIPLQAIAFCIVGIGPGSYTGIRASIAFTKGLAVALKIPLVPISGLYGLVPDHEGEFIAALDAKIGGVFCAQGIRIGDRVVWKSEPERVENNEFQKRLQLVDGVVVIECSWLQTKGFCVDAVLSTTAPKAVELIRLGFEYQNSGKAVVPKQLHPLYLRKTQAEIERSQLLKVTLES